MEALRIHHLGVAVEDLDEAFETYEQLFGAELEHRETLEDQGVEAVACGWARAASSCWALWGRTRRSAGSSPSAGPACTTSPTRSTTSRRPSATSPTRGAQLIDEEPRPGLYGLQVAFVHPDSVHGVLAEVVIHEG